MNDPRHNLEPGTYWATVVRTGSTNSWHSGKSLELMDRLIPGSREALERLEFEPWIDYTLPNCGDWVWRIESGRNGVTPEFIQNAIKQGGFEWEKLPFGEVPVSPVPKADMRYAMYPETDVW